MFFFVCFGGVWGVWGIPGPAFVFFGGALGGGGGTGVYRASPALLKILFLAWGFRV